MQIINANFIDNETKQQVFEAIRFFEDKYSKEEIIKYFSCEIYDEHDNHYDFSDEERYTIKIEKLSLISWHVYLIDRKKRLKKDKKLSEDEKKKAIFATEMILSSFCGYGGNFPSKFKAIEFALDLFIKSRKKDGLQPRLISADVEEMGKTFYHSEIPQVSFDDVVGLDEAKKAIRDKFIDPDTYKDIYDALKIRTGGGILMYGVPGTGKTMLAQAVAHEINAKFFSIRCSDIMSKWFGESERSVKQLFEEARYEKKSVLFIDEIDAITKKSNLASSCAGTLIAEMKAQMQGVDTSNRNVLIIGATNHPELIDPAFLRPGRFDIRTYIPLPNKEARIAIIEKRLRGIPHNLTIESLEELGDRTNDFNCSDVDYLCETAKIIAKDVFKASKRATMRVELEDFVEALKTVKSSVDRCEEKRLKDWSI